MFVASRAVLVDARVRTVDTTCFADDSVLSFDGLMVVMALRDARVNLR